MREKLSYEVQTNNLALYDRPDEKRTERDLAGTEIMTRKGDQENGFKVWRHSGNSVDSSGD